MNSLVALPIAAAVPTTAPAMDFPLAPIAPPASADLELVELAERLIVAVAESRRLHRIAEEMEDAYRMSGFPEALRVRPGDAEFGRTTWESTDEFWHRPCDIDKWRHIHTSEHKIEDNTDGFVVTVRMIKPTDELRQRAEEIVAAYDKWDAEHQNPPGYKAAKRAYEKAADIETALEQQIDAIQATTIEGMIAKARCAEAYHFENGTVDFSVSIAKDLLALQVQTPTPVNINSPVQAPVTPVADAELVELGRRFEPLVDRYYVAQRRWSRSLAAAHAEHDQEFGDPADRNYEYPPEIVAAFSNSCERLGANEADDALSAIHEEMKEVANAINAASVTSIEGLRAKALVAFWEVAPLAAGDTEFSFDDAYPFQQLFTAVAEACGLEKKIAATGYKLPELEMDEDEGDLEEDCEEA
jgi:hypothetical protein